MAVGTALVVIFVASLLLFTQVGRAILVLLVVVAVVGGVYFYNCNQRIAAAHDACPEANFQTTPEGLSPNSIFHDFHGTNWAAQSRCIKEHGG
jgi:hypothetical protein